MGFRPASRREALLEELCAQGGYCTTGLVPEDLGGDLSVDEIADKVMRGEGLDPVMDRQLRQEVAHMVADWLFDPSGRGARSGLPR